MSLPWSSDFSAFADALFQSLPRGQSSLSVLVPINDTISLAKQEPIQPIQTPSPVLTGYWSEHEELYGFLLVTHDKFSPAVEEAPNFPFESVSDMDLSPGLFGVSVAGLIWYNSAREWEYVVRFSKEDISFVRFLARRYQYFQLV